jgi:hypothetical protein
MKKALVFLLILAVAGGLFAVDLGNGVSLAGEIVTGAIIKTDGPADTTKFYAGHSDPDLNRLRLTLGYASDIFGFSYRLEAKEFNSMSQTNHQGAQTLDTAFAYGWVDLLDSKIRLVGGKIDSNAWGLGKVINFDDPAFDDVLGARVEFKVVDGLNFGLALPLRYPGATSVEIDKSLTNFILGAFYSADAFKVVASAYISASDYTAYSAPADRTSAAAVATSGGFVDSWLGVEIPLDAIGIGVNVRFDSRDTVGYIQPGARVNFAKDAFSFYVKGNAKIWFDDDTKDAAISFELRPTYKINDLVTVYLNIASGNVADFGKNGLNIRPVIDFNVSSNVVLEIRDDITRIGHEDGKVSNKLGLNATFKF